ncbi:MAG: aminodeoxychorismate synthase component I [Bacteroidetes bacterium]|jgi:para-aminobenzoate synthetase component 1|nr:aminodeoxychorismate synthase component I [Bacteroidota bacterium]
MSSINPAFEAMNSLGRSATPFLFVIDFALREPLVKPLNTIDANQLKIQIGSYTNHSSRQTPPAGSYKFSSIPPDKQSYRRSFEQVMFHLQRGDSYLLNLTMPVRIKTSLTLEDIYFRSKASYKIWWRDRFTVFSPEPFVKIDNGMIYTFPMKGTIDANVPNAEARLLADPKERAEHFTIVDLLRNDLNSVAQNVHVDRFRYVEKIQTSRGALLQTSSVISGKLPTDYAANLGSIFAALLPAGSISGAPKKRTVELIQLAENYQRGFYTGVMGVFDGKSLNSCVLIRFIEKDEKGLIFKAGGGITVNSKWEDEYAELLQKVYLPF